MNEGTKFDNGKPNFDLIPIEPLEELQKVLEYGAKKYSVNNWMLLPDFNKRYFNAAVRHLWAWLWCEKYDKESGLPHLAHAFCNLMFLVWKSRKDTDNQKRMNLLYGLFKDKKEERDG
jgi:hypothetical protein